MKTDHLSDRELLRYSMAEEKDPALEAHLTQCDRCRARLEAGQAAFGAARRSLRPLRDEAMRRYLGEQARATLQQAPTPAERAPNRRGILRLALGAVSLLAVIGVVALFLFRESKAHFQVATATRSMIKSPLRGNQAGLPFRISTDTPDTCRISGLLGTEAQFSGPGSLSIEEKKQERYRMRLARGELIMDTRGKLPPIDIHTPHGRFTITGTRFLITTSTQASRLLVFQGQVRVEAGGRTLTVPSEESVRIRRQGISRKKLRDNLIPLQTLKRLQSVFPRDFHYSGKIGNVKETDPEPKSRTPGPAGYTERIYLADGTVISGKITAISDSTITMRTYLGTMNIARSKVARIEYIGKR